MPAMKTASHIETRRLAERNGTRQGGRGGMGCWGNSPARLVSVVLLAATTCSGLVLPLHQPIKTLLIDNYDSYTYNLFHQLAKANGVSPHVVYNDAHGGDLWKVIELMEEPPHNIVLSPGPGHPGNEADFGMCRQALEEAPDIPLLGVCLGHQGLGRSVGGHVRRMPEVMHGRFSPVFHNGAGGMFEGVEQGFKVVRYHSLAVDAASVEEGCEVTAWTSDGVVMGLKHRERPHWGLQFHPESIGTQAGDRLIENFRDLTRSWYEGEQPRGMRKGGRKRWQTPVVLGNKKEGHESMTQQGMGVEVEVETEAEAEAEAETGKGGFKHVLNVSVVEFEDGLPDTEIFFREFFGDKVSSWWLDSSNKRPGLGDGVSGQAPARFSFMGGSDNPHLLEYWGGLQLWETTDGTSRFLQRGLLDHLKGQSREWSEDAVGVRVDGAGQVQKAGDVLPFDFLGGYVGFFGYEMRHATAEVLSEMEGSEWDWDGTVGSSEEVGSGKRSEQPQAMWMHADHFISFDHSKDVAYVIQAVPEGDEAVADAAEDSWRRATTAAVEELKTSPVPVEKIPRMDSALSEMVGSSCHTSRPRYTYESNIEEVQKQISAGETYEVCLTNAVVCDRCTPALREDPLDLYAKLRRSNPAPYAAFLSFESFAVLCSSPERFLRVERGGWVESKPIKGTARRGSTREEDQSIIDFLNSSEKIAAENLMIVDLVRNDLGRVCQVGSVHVPALMKVESYATVHQVVSTIRGLLRQHCGAIDAVAASFPGGSMTGAPKKRTIEIIDELEEGAPRGIYSGSIGYLSKQGAADLNIVIRTAVVTPTEISIGAGGAIIALSDVQAEYDEMQLKAQSVLGALGVPLEEALRKDAMDKALRKDGKDMAASP